MTPCIDLGLHGMLARAIERLDPQVLLDPFEEQLDLPAAPVDLGNCKCGQSEVVGQKGEPLLGNGVSVADAAQCIGARFGGLEGG